MASILVTGGAGFIGSNLVDTLAGLGHQVVAVDDFSTGKPAYVSQSKQVVFIKADVNNRGDIAKIFKDHSFDYVYHYAAVVGVQRTLHNPIKVLRDIDGIRNILDLSVDNNINRVFFSSSSEVYGEPVEMPQHEERTPLNSRLPYAVVKNVGESFLRSYKQECGLDYTIFRFFNTYGPRQSEDFVISKFLASALKDEDLTIYGAGDQTRTFCYIDDNVEAAIKTMDDKTTIDEVINIGSDKEIKIIDLAKKIVELSGSGSRIVHLPALKEGDMTRRQPDITKMEKLLQRPLTPLDDGLKNLLSYMEKY